MARIVSLALTLSIALTAIPLATAHGTLNAREVETLVLSDEASDAMEAWGGYDIVKVYIGEAWIAGLGDGLYFHTLLSGGPGAPPANGDYKVTFTLVPATGAPITRSITTSDGKKFATDFDNLEVKTDEGTEVDRAFIRYDGASLAPGTVIKSFKVESFVNGDLRDRAPGGVFLPQSRGAAEIPQGTSTQTVKDYTIAGPTKYAAVTIEPTGQAWTYRATLKTLLTKGDQHIHFEIPEWADLDPVESGWSFTALTPTSAEVKANQSLTVEFRLQPVGDQDQWVRPVGFNVTTDIGGRNGVIAHLEKDTVVFTPGDASSGLTATKLPAAIAKSPALPTSLLLGSVAMLAGVLHLRHVRARP